MVLITMIKIMKFMLIMTKYGSDEEDHNDNYKDYDEKG